MFWYALATKFLAQNFSVGYRTSMNKIFNIVNVAVLLLVVLVGGRVLHA